MVSCFSLLYCYKIVNKSIDKRYNKNTKFAYSDLFKLGANKKIRRLDVVKQAVSISGFQIYVRRDGYS